MNAKLSRIKWMRTLGNGSYVLGAAFLIASMLVNAFPTSAAFAKANSGAIWTTSGSCGQPQNVNHYQAGDRIYINGSGFSAGDHDWHIKGQPGGASGDPGDVVASGTVTVGSSGAFCFSAYTVHADDWGEYSVKVGNKGDNYNVTAPIVPTATSTTPVDTATPTDTATATPADTEQPTSTPTDVPGQPTATPTDTATATPTEVEQPTATTTDLPGGPTATPADTATPSPTDTATPHPTGRPGLHLHLSSFCGPDSNQLNWWRIVNKDSTDAGITWKIMPLGAPADDYLLPGNSTYEFSTPKSSEDDQLYVYDALGQLVDTVSAANNCKSNKPTPTQVPNHPNPATPDAQVQVLIPVTGADLQAGTGMRVMFFNLGIGFLGLGLVLNGVARQRKNRDI